MLPTRRQFLYSILAYMGLWSVAGMTASAEQQLDFQGLDVFDRIMRRATADQWSALPIGEVMGRVAKELEGTPYKEATLELSPDKEICSVNLAGLDCVTFFESTLDLARTIKSGGKTSADLLKQIAYTRYRGGNIGDYSSRLHYTTDWFIDNAKKGVVKLLTELPGSEPFIPRVGFMTGHPEKYRQLAAHPELIPAMRRVESIINSYSTLKYVPMDRLAGVEKLLKTGDIVGVCTSQAGIDIAHTGIIFRDEQGVAHFMDASSKKSRMKVTIESGPISGALNWSKNLSGAMFARPLEPSGSVR